MLPNALNSIILWGLMNHLTIRNYEGLSWLFLPSMILQCKSGFGTASLSDLRAVSLRRTLITVSTESSLSVNIGLTYGDKVSL